MGSVRRRRIRKLLSTAKYQALFDEQFFEQVMRRRDELESLLLKLFILQAPIFILLAVSLIPNDVQFSFFGLSPQGTKGLREIFLIVSAFLGLFSASISGRLRNMSDLLLARAEQLAHGPVPTFPTRATEGTSEASKDVEAVLSLAYGVLEDWNPLPLEKEVTGSKLKTVVQVLMLVFATITLMFFSMLVAYIQIAVYLAVYDQPSISRGFSVAVIALSVASTITIFLRWYANRGVFTYASEEWAVTFEAWKKRQPEIYARLIRLAELKHQQRNRLWRYFTHPNPVREARELHRRMKKMAAAKRSMVPVQ